MRFIGFSKSSKDCQQFIVLIRGVKKTLDCYIELSMDSIIDFLEE